MNISFDHLGDADLARKKAQLPNQYREDKMM